MFYKPEDLNFDTLFEQNLDISLLKYNTIKEWDKHIESICKANSEVIELTKDDTIIKGDIVELNIQSENSRFNKNNVIITIGIGLYCLELENKIIGMKLCQSSSIEFLYKSNNIVSNVEIISVKRNIPHKINDELVKLIPECENSLDTIEKYKYNWCKISFQAAVQDEFITKLYMKIVNELVSKSEIVPTNESLEKEKKLYLDWEKSEIENYQTKLEYYKATFGNNILDEADGDKKVDIHIKAKAGLREYYKKLAEINNLEIKREVYESEIENYANEQGFDKNELMKSITYDDYKDSLMTENLSKQLLKLLDKYINSKGEIYE